MRRTLVAFDYHRLGKADRGCVRRYGVKVTGFSPAQLTRLVARHAETGAGVDLRARNQRATVRDAVQADRHSAAGRGR